jgi:hypothetical protein
MNDALGTLHALRKVRKPRWSAARSRP